LANPRVEGLTCCHDDDLLNPATEFNRRIDHIFLSEPFKAKEADIVGDDPVQRTPGGLWPSDHAGLAAQLQLRPVRRTASR
ncbi:MAG: hypothetical protein HUU43_06760, partial [Ignavibacteriaceae bacterium]|nr:hypothetical protein [Ignavibacteriaceae bacterium]